MPRLPPELQYACITGKLGKGQVANKGLSFPPLHCMRDWTFEVLSMRGFISAIEQKLIKDHIQEHWDPGAYRTFYAYFYGYNELAEEVLHEYYKSFYIPGWGWSCRYPSAAAVWQCRSSWAAAINESCKVS